MATHFICKMQHFDWSLNDHAVRAATMSGSHAKYN